MRNNNLNICPRCGSANTPVAKYCFQCGMQLVVTEQPVVCGKCKTVNAANSAYCKSCGTMLAENANSKICPRCNSYVSSAATICAKCGYSFSGATQIQPAANPGGAVLKPPKRVKTMPVGAAKARLGGLKRLLLALVAAYILIMPSFMAIGALDFGFYKFVPVGLPENTVTYNGYDIITSIISGLGSAGGGFFGQLTLNQWIIYILFAVTLLVLAVEILSGLVRLLNGKLPKKRNGFALFMMVIFIIATAYLLLNQYASEFAAAADMPFIKTFFEKWAAISTTKLWVNYYLMGGYYLIIFIVSLIFKKPKQQVMQVGR